MLPLKKKIPHVAFVQNEFGLPLLPINPKKKEIPSPPNLHLWPPPPKKKTSSALHVHETFPPRNHIMTPMTPMTAPPEIRSEKMRFERGIESKGPIKTMIFLSPLPQAPTPRRSGLLGLGFSSKSLEFPTPRPFVCKHGDF